MGVTAVVALVWTLVAVLDPSLQSRLLAWAGFAAVSVGVFMIVWAIAGAESHVSTKQQQAAYRARAEQQRRIAELRTPVKPPNGPDDDKPFPWRPGTGPSPIDC